MIANVHRREQYDVYIGRANGRYHLRGSSYANPFVIGRDGDRAEVIARFERWARTSPDAAARWIREHVAELDGLTLGCWCDGEARGEPCHGDVLLRMAAEAKASQQRTQH